MIDRPPQFSVLGVPVSIIDRRTAYEAIRAWRRAGTAQLVCIRDVHGLMQSLEDPAMLAIQRMAGMVTPDGMPLVWIGRLQGHREIERVCGADLVEFVCDHGREDGLRHFFYGGKPGVAEKMAERLKQRFPGLQIAGTYCPPFRPLSTEEDADVVALVRQTETDVLWVGISTPKQEFWMRDHLDRLPGVTMLGVGAAFDFISSEVRRAPLWMQRAGLEWLHRLCSEPRRLWRRYLVMAPKFVFMLAASEAVRRFRSRTRPASGAK